MASCLGFSFVSSLVNVRVLASPTYMNSIGTVGSAILASLAWFTYWNHSAVAPCGRCARGWVELLTFNPIHLIVPTSAADRGDRILEMTSTLSVNDPGSKAEVPLNSLTCTSSPVRTALPTSTSGSTGWPMSTALSFDFGTNRTSPIMQVT